MAWRSPGYKHLFRLERKDTEVTLGIHADQFVGAELEEFGRRFPWELKDNGYPSLPKDVDLAAPELSVIGAYGEERLDRIVCDSTDLGVDAVSSILNISMLVSNPFRNSLERKCDTSSIAKRSGASPSDRSFWIPACLPLRK